MASRVAEWEARGRAAWPGDAIGHVETARLRRRPGAEVGACLQLRVRVGDARARTG